jgi:DNA gyrase subunit A
VTGPIASARIVHQDDDLTIISSGGIVIRTKIKQIKSAGRATMGVRVINLKEGETVASVARTSAKDLKQAGVE